MSGVNPTNNNSGHEPHDRQLTRRQIIKLSGGMLGALIVGPVLAACGNSSGTGGNGAGTGGNTPGATNPPSAGGSNPTAGATTGTGAKGTQATEPTPGSTVISTGKKQSANAKEVTFWTAFTDIYLQAIADITKQFNQKNPDVFVKLVQVPSGSTTDTTKLLTAVRGGTGPDAYHIDRFLVAQQAAVGVLQPLDQYIGDEDMKSKYLDFAWAEASFKGKPYAMPFDTDARVMYYRNDSLKKAGVDPKEWDIKNGPLTLDRVREVSDKITKKDSNGHYTHMGFVPWYNQGFLHYTWGFDFGGKFFDPGACKVTPTDQGVVDAYQMGYDWAKRVGSDEIQRFLASYNRPDAPPQQSPFLQGRIGIEISGDWELAGFKKYAPKMDYGLTYIPVRKEGDDPSTWAGGFAFAIPQGAKEPEAAYKFLRYISGEDGQRYYTKTTAHLPTWKSLLSDKKLFPGRHWLFANQLLPVAKNRPPLPVGALYWDQLTSAQEKVTLLKSEPKPALEDVASRVNSQLQPYCPIK